MNTNNGVKCNKIDCSYHKKLYFTSTINSPPPPLKSPTLKCQKIKDPPGPPYYYIFFCIGIIQT